MQKDILCQWHEQDPVDEKEMEPNLENSFVSVRKSKPLCVGLQSCFPHLLWNVSTSCRLLDVQQTTTSSGLVYQSATSTLILPEGSRALWVYDLTGRLLYMKPMEIPVKN